MCVSGGFIKIPALTKEEYHYTAVCYFFAPEPFTYVVETQSL